MEKKKLKQKQKQYEPMTDDLFETFCAVKKFQEEFKEGTKDYEGCDWCCGVGDEWLDELLEGYKELGCETEEEFEKKFEAERRRRNLI